MQWSRPQMHSIPHVNWAPTDGMNWHHSHATVLLWGWNTTESKFNFRMQVKDTCPKTVGFKAITLTSEPLFPLAAIVVWRAGDVGCKVTTLEPLHTKPWCRFPLYDTREDGLILSFNQKYYYTSSPGLESGNNFTNFVACSKLIKHIGCFLYHPV